MSTTDQQAAAAWRVADLEQDQSWIFSLSDAAARQLARTVMAAYDPERPLFDYAREDFDLGPAWETIAAALQEAHHGRGVALVHGLPRADLSEDAQQRLHFIQADTFVHQQTGKGMS